MPAFYDRKINQMNKIIIPLSLFLLISEVLASTYSIYVIENYDSSFEEESEIKVKTLLARADRIKMFAQTEGVSSADDPGTVQTHSVFYVEKHY